MEKSLIDYSYEHVAYLCNYLSFSLPVYVYLQGFQLSQYRYNFCGEIYWVEWFSSQGYEAFYFVFITW